MDEATIAKYQTGGAYYVQLAAQYGQAAADRIAAAAATGDQSAVNEAFAYVRSGAAQDSSTLDIFFQQITTDPLKAPLDALDAGVKKIFDSEGVKTIATIAIVAAIGLVILHAELTK